MLAIEPAGVVERAVGSGLSDQPKELGSDHEFDPRLVELVIVRLALLVGQGLW